MKGTKMTKKRIFVFFSIILIVEIIFLGFNHINNLAEKNVIENSLNDKSIKNGVVMDNSKDEKDISESEFKKMDKTNKKIHSHYKLDNIELPRFGFDTELSVMPPKGKNIDNIERKVDPKNNNLLNLPFKKYVVFYPTHQDDEVLWAASAIREAVNERGADHVFIALVTSGTGHKFFKNKKFEKMNVFQKAEYRNREFMDSCLSLGIPKKNIIFLYKERADGKTDFNIERKFALEMEKKYKSVTHVTHSYKYDDHFMHRANGQTLYELWQKGEIKDVRFFIKPFLLKYVDATKNFLNIYSVNNQMEYNMIKNACKAYKYYNPTKGRYGIGYRTDFISFDKLVNDPGERCYIIIQNNKEEG